MAATSVLHPPVMWAQRRDKLYVTINVEDCHEEHIDLTSSYLKFTSKGGPENRDYGIDIDFNEEVNPDESKFVVTARNVTLMIKKKKDGKYWPRLRKQENKVHWLKTDFNKWLDEDDSDTEDKKNDYNLEQMMSSMGGLDGAGMPDMAAGGENNEEDSDDEGKDSDQTTNIKT